MLEGSAHPIEEAFLNLDGSLATWEHTFSDEEGRARALLPLGVAAILTGSVWVLQAINGALVSNWGFGVFLLAVGAGIAFVRYYKRSERRFSNAARDDNRVHRAKIAKKWF